MKDCPKCNAQLEDDTIFCTRCGEKQITATGSPAIRTTNEAQPVSQKRGLLIGGIVLFILLFGGGWYYKVYTSSPDYIVSKMVASSQKLYEDKQNTYYIDKGSLDSTTGNSTEFDVITITKDGITRKNRVVLYYSHKNPNKWGWYDKNSPKELHDVSYSDFSGYAKDWIQKIDGKVKTKR